MSNDAAVFRIRLCGCNWHDRVEIRAEVKVHDRVEIRAEVHLHLSVKFDPVVQVTIGPKNFRN
jgi:hypothetical protein